MDNPQDINYFGLTNFRAQKTKFGIKPDDRRRHFYCIGKTGMGKSNLMENMAIQDIQSGRGLAYVDPHGEGAEKLLEYVPEDRINDVIFFNPADLDFPIAFNVMEKVDFRYRHLVAGGLMGVFKKVWPDVWSARMEYILNNAILALLEYPDATLLGVNRMLADPEYRAKVVANITDPIVKSFWAIEFAKYSQKYEQEATAAIQNKVGQFISNPLIRNIIGQTKSTINMRDIMDSGKILIIDLSKGRIGEENSRLLGALLVTKLQLAAMSRVDIPENARRDFYLYVDEFQNFATESFAGILSEARKYRLALILGHQYVSQMEDVVRDAVFGNVGTLVVFRVGAEDAEALEREFTPVFTAEDLVNLPKYNVYLKLMIDGVAGHPFSAETLPPPQPLEVSNRDKLIKASRERYGVSREVVDEKIMRWTGLHDENGVAATPAAFVPKSPAPRSTPSSYAPRPAAPFQQREGDRRNNPSQNRPPVQNSAPVPVPADRPTPGSAPQTTLYDAVCSNCGKPTKVIFPPEPGRPVFCKNCLKKMKTQGQALPRHEAARPGAMFGEEVPLTTVSFGSRRNEQKDPAKPQRKREINLSELKKVLEDSLPQKPKPPAEPEPTPTPQPEQKPAEQSGIIKPGEKIQL